MSFAQKIVLGYFRAKINLVGVVSPDKAARIALKLFSTPWRKAGKKAPPIFTKAEEIGFRLNGRKVHGYRWNHPSDHKFLILHGFESSSFSFDRYVKPMIRQGYEVVAVDAPAHGKSEGHTINLPEYVSSIEETDKLFGPFHAWMAHSFGGLAICLFLEKHPAKQNGRLVLIAPATETTTAIHSFFALLQITKSVQHSFLKLIRTKTGVDPSWFSLKRIAPHLKTKVLWIHDEKDDVTPLKDVQPLIRNPPSNIAFKITNGLGHRSIYRDNQVSKSIIDFFSRNSSANSSPGKPHSKSDI